MESDRGIGNIKQSTADAAGSSGNNNTVPSKPHKEPLHRDDKNVTPGDMASNSKEYGSRHTDTTSPVSNLTHESTMLTMSPTQSPPTQAMERPAAGYDPSRIPSSVFNRKSNAAMDWSVASNESLFSIHTGNNSFSREQALMFGGDFTSQELFCRELTESGELIKFGPPPQVAIDRENDRTSVDGGKSYEPTAEENKKINNVQHEIANEECILPSLEMSPSRRSDVSGMSNQSFAFPILAEMGTSISMREKPEQQHPRHEQQQHPHKEPQPMPKPQPQSLPEPQPHPHPEPQPPLAKKSPKGFFKKRFCCLPSRCCCTRLWCC